MRCRIDSLQLLLGELGGELQAIPGLAGLNGIQDCNDLLGLQRVQLVGEVLHDGEKQGIKLQYC